MAFSYACLTLQRVVLPIVLVLAALYRPVGISFVYLLMFFVSPFIPVAKKENFKGSVSAYFIILIAISTILILCHVGLQIAIYALHITDLFGTCSVTERLLRHIGFIGFQNLKPFAIVEWLAPEVVVFITSLVVYIVCKKITQTVEPQVENGDSDLGLQGVVTEGESIANATVIPDEVEKQKNIPENDEPNFNRLIAISPLFCLATLFFAGVLRPSIPGAFYFLVFLIFGSYWATYRPLQTKFAKTLRFVMVVIVIHTICIVAYQTPWMQDHLDKKSLTARLLALEPLVTSVCDNDIRIIVYDTSYKIDSFLNPIVLFFTYYALSLTTKNLVQLKIITKAPTAFGHEIDNNSAQKLQRQISLLTQTATRNNSSSKKDVNRTKSQRINVALCRDQQRPQIKTEPTESTPLMRSSGRKPTAAVITDTNNSGGGGAMGAQPNTNDIPLTSMEGHTRENSGANENKTAGILDQIGYGITGLGGFIYQNSYIFTNVLMMAWSIVYHSWLTFVLLLWANVLWMIPNQRTAMMRSSLFIVIYTELLLIAQYVYGMNLTKDELATEKTQAGINLVQIGFQRPQENDVQPAIPLIVKTCFVLMFWVTLRQYFQEKDETRRTGNISDIFAPLHLTMRSSVGAPDETDKDGEHSNKFLRKIGSLIKNLLVRLWIWLLILVIFLCAMTGDETMTGFRICYMALFLFFLLVFQSSSKVWVKLMYGFWLFLIFYAMSILILIYTYQFDQFPIYWTVYLNINDKLQKGIGLKKYETKDFLLHLISPTLIVILTVIQVHYFHKLLIASMSKQQTEDSQSVGTHQKQRRITRYSTGAGFDITDFTESAGDLVRLFFKRLFAKAAKFFRHFKGVFWRLLELHWVKAVYITAFVCAVSEVSFMHIPLVVLSVIGVVSKVRMRIFLSRIISLVVALLVLAKMIYQINVWEHHNYDAECVEGGETKVTGNNAEWFGLTKADKDIGLMGLIKKYIIYMIVATLHAVITLRQHQMRLLQGTENDPKPKVPFASVTREHAERSLENMTKYLFNYGFYKFGYEICLICLVSTITYRQDIVALAYAMWLVILLVFKRKKLAYIWGVFLIFVLCSIILQYILLVHFPPKTCIKYIWEDNPQSEFLQRWALLPGHLNHPHAHKLIFDFILLLLLHLQKRVFALESIPNYPGGSNASVIKDIKNLGKVEFVNPTQDFLSNIRNYLDILKHVVLCGFYWITLAVVFLAGTTIPDFLSLGYLVGAFMFLWEGSEFYLRPINSILKRWKIFIAYNVANIVIKTCLQLAGCMFMEQLANHACWLVHLLALNCASEGRINPASASLSQAETGCPPVKFQIILLWDAICFAFLIFQLRIFKSHYFCHIITDGRAVNILASRGGEIIEHLRQTQIGKRQEFEEDVLHKIKRKMEKIRANQQKMLRSLEKPTHFDVMPTDSMLNTTSNSNGGSGYHTPVGAGRKRKTIPILVKRNDVTIASDSENEYTVKQRNLTLPEIEIQCNTPQPATPSTDALTMPLEGFLEAPRLSCYSRTPSDLSQPKYNDLEEDESNEVFTMSAKSKPAGPLQLSAKTLQADVGNKSAPCSLISSNDVQRESICSIIRDEHHRRQSSSNNAVSWNDTISVKCPQSSNDDPTPIMLNSEEAQVTLRKRLHRRHQSVGNAMEDNGSHRRSSNLWWAQEEALRHNAQRPNSWGPLEHGNPIYSTSIRKRKEFKLHPDAVRAGDYYMFEDVDNKFELDLIMNSGRLFDADTENITESEIKMNRRKTLYDVWKDISNEEYRRHLRQRSYASAPPSNVDLLSDDHYHDEDNDTGAGIRISTLSEPLCYAQRSASEDFESLKPKSPKDVMGPTTSSNAQKQELNNEDSLEFSDDEDLEYNPIIRLMEGFLVSLTIRLNRLSRNYRYVNKILAEEKKALKESNALYMFSGRYSSRNAAVIFQMIKGNMNSDKIDDPVSQPQPPPSQPASSTSSKRNSVKNAPTPSIMNIQDQQQPQQLQPQQQLEQQQPLPTQINHNNTYESMHSQSHEPQSSSLPNTSSFDPQQKQLPKEQQHSRDDINAIESSSDVVDSREQTMEANKFMRSKGGRKSEPLPEIRIKAPSFDRTHRGSGSLISKQWPNEKVISTDIDYEEDEDFTSRDHNIVIEVLISAWFAILSNTDIICYIVVFINQIVNATLISLPLPLMIFIWGTLSVPRPTKTFWVTLIAYTQAIVFIKCIFQFNLIWTNYHHSLPNDPLAVEKLFGFEAPGDYATYDLLLLLVLFFHRYILKSHGLWKTDRTNLYQAGERESLNGSTSNSEHETPINSIQDRSLARSNENLKSSSTHRYDAASHSNELLAKRVESCHQNKYLCGLSKFFDSLLHKARLPTDVYALMFFCDFINFFVLLFGFTAFSESKISDDGGVKTYLAENKVPIPFLIMLLVQFCVIVMDRALYLRKALKMKIAFHFISVLGIHFWMFFIVPAVTERSFYASTPPIIFYIIKCFYLLLSSYQIKCGYPARILGNFLTKSFSMVNMIAFKVYMVIPFLYELRTILDWLCTDTTMTLFDWLKMEDIFANIYSIKCVRQMEADLPAPRAIKKEFLMKFLVGGGIIFFIVLFIWGPLTLFALFNAVGQPNPPTEVKVSLRIGSYEPIYVTNTREATHVFTEDQYASMQNLFYGNKEASEFLVNYHASDISAILISGSSPTIWNIAPPDKLRLLNELEANSNMTFRLAFEVTRTPPTKGQSGTVAFENTFGMNDTYAYRSTLLAMMKGNESEGKAIIPNIVPKFVKILNSGHTIMVSDLVGSNSDYGDLAIEIHSTNDMFQWWEISDHCVDNDFHKILKQLPYYSCTSGLVFYTFSDKKFPSTWTFITAGGIIGIYTTFVLVVSRFLKSFLGEQTKRIMYQDLPNVDRVLQLCLDIYLVREALEFALEEDLFAKLLFLYRSPETMIKWTRPIGDIGDDETDSDSMRSKASKSEINTTAVQELY